MSDHVEHAAREPSREPPRPLASVESTDTELVFGLVAPVGTDLEAFQPLLEAQLLQYGYNTNSIRLSHLLRTIDLARWGIELAETPAARRLDTYMTAGSKLREKTRQGGVLALYAIAQIVSWRGAEEHRPRSAHVLRSLKHPDEVRALRRVYGPGFYLIALSASRDERVRNLMRDMTREEVIDVMKRDESENVPLGQHTRDTFELADVFLTTQDVAQGLRRFLELVFGNPFVTPTREEHAMFMAHAASIRSGSLSRQIGAAIMAPTGEIIATGSNDVPSPEGGLYWPDGPDERDYRRGFDSNDREKARIIRALLKNPDLSEEEALTQGRELFKETGILNLTEFGRDVHAEMDALLSCARIQVSPRDSILFGTTFPCHNCAKHIVAAGVSEVVYIEAYPKSLALELHPDAITTDSACRGERVLFRPFVGIGPRRYFEFFSTTGITTGFRVYRKTKDGRLVQWTHGKAKPRTPLIPNSYLEREKLVSRGLNELTAWLEQQPTEAREGDLGGQQ